MSNLRCKTVGDFRWYKDVYLSKVYTRSNANQSYWKERFLHGLPKSLYERVQSRIKDKYDRIIPYDFLTYGELINFISQEALSLCSLIRINAKIKQEFKISKKELGYFCS